MITMSCEITINAPHVDRERWQARMTEARQTIALTVAASTQENYAQAAAAGQTWPPRKKSYPWPPLWKTGLKRQTELDSAAQGFIQENEHSYTLAIRSPEYGKFHQFGSKNLPIRKSIAFHPEDLQAMAMALRRVAD
jgi:phage gpG-like protein